MTPFREPRTNLVTLGLVFFGGLQTSAAQLFSTLEGQSGSHFRVRVSVRKIGIGMVFD
jgi:hypothetical protein